MRICIVGAGAIGGYVAVKLALAGEEVTVIARGDHLKAIRQNGLTLLDHDGTEVGVAKNIRATDSIAEAGKQDVVILAVKAHQVIDVVDELPLLYGPDTVMVTMQNGIPFWYFKKLGGNYEDLPVHIVDPEGEVLKRVDIERVIGCVVYPAADRVRPGVIRHIEGDRFPLGELDGRPSERIKKVSEVFTHAGMKAPVFSSESERPGTRNIRDEIWLKLWGNLSFNPISALTHATLVDLCTYPLTHDLAASMMREAQAVAEKLGASFRVSLERRIEGGAEVGKHKTSTLQDVEAGHEIEVDALIGAVQELGQVTKTPTPHIDSVFALVKLLAKVMKDEHVAIKPVPVSS
ncbi:MAG: 2-dehydropantoate 2-reductase [Proteobacteria bacterium]|nr:2-dehydropantoate 2-reductase [Pseudomonadota bacterium]MDE3207862.1 2-dehydropantoate 2-reductase [Pseudomonadota bacterium]